MLSWNNIESLFWTIWTTSCYWLLNLVEKVTRGCDGPFTVSLFLTVSNRLLLSFYPTIPLNSKFSVEISCNQPLSCNFYLCIKSEVNSPPGIAFMVCLGWLLVVCNIVLPAVFLWKRSWQLSLKRKNIKINFIIQSI